MRRKLNFKKLVKHIVTKHAKHIKDLAQRDKGNVQQQVKDTK